MEHEIIIVVFNEELGERRELRFRGPLAEIKVAAFDEQVRLQDEGFFLSSAKVRVIEDAA